MHAYDLISYQSSYHTKSQPSYHSKPDGSGAFSVSGPCMWRTKLPMDLAIFLAETQDTSFFNEHVIIFLFCLYSLYNFITRLAFIVVIYIFILSV